MSESSTNNTKDLDHNQVGGELVWRKHFIADRSTGYVNGGMDEQEDHPYSKVDPSVLLHNCLGEVFICCSHDEAKHEDQHERKEWKGKERVEKGNKSLNRETRNEQILSYF